MKTENGTNKKRINGIVKTVKKENDTIQFAYITDDTKDYPVTANTIQRIANASAVLVQGKKVSFTIYHGNNKDYANDILPVPVNEKTQKFDLMDISNLSDEVQKLVNEYCEKIDLRKSILTTLSQPNYINLSKEEYIDAYLKRLKSRYFSDGIAPELVTELIEYYWSIKKA